MDIGVLLRTTLITTQELIRICNACNMAFVDLAKDWSITPPRISSFSMTRSTIRYYLSLDDETTESQDMHVRSINVHQLFKLGLPLMIATSETKPITIATMIFQELARLCLDPDGNDWWHVVGGAIAMEPCGLRISRIRNYDVDGDIQLCHWIKPGELEDPIPEDCWGSGIFKTTAGIVGLLVIEGTPEWYRELKCKDIILPTHGADIEDDMPPMEFDIPKVNPPSSARLLGSMSNRLVKSRAMSNLNPNRSAITDLEHIEKSLEASMEPIQYVERVHIPPAGVNRLRLPTSDSSPSKHKPISPSTRLELLETLTQTQRANEKNTEKDTNSNTNSKYEHETLKKILELLELVAKTESNTESSGVGLVLGHLMLEIKVTWK